MDTATISSIYDYNQVIMSCWVYTRADENGALLKLQDDEPTIKKYVYRTVNEVDTSYEGANALVIDNISRYSDSRGHSMGSIESHQDWYILDIDTGKRVINGPYSNPPEKEIFLLDFTNSDLISYATEAIQTDLTGGKWGVEPDGIYIDDCLSLIDKGVYSGNYSKPLNTGEEWANSMSLFVSGITIGMYGIGFNEVQVNRGSSKDVDGRMAWDRLDGEAASPDTVMEEGAFVVRWFNEDAGFYSVNDWLYQLNTFINSRGSVVMLSHVKASTFNEIDLTTNRGETLSVRDAHKYAFGSFLLGYTPSKDFFSFCLSDYSSPPEIDSENELNYIDIGEPIGFMFEYQGVYCREFDKGYVYVNPSGTPKNITLQEPMGIYSIQTKKLKNKYLNKVTSITVNSCRAVFAFK